jgi:hypothetical protein
VRLAPTILIAAVLLAGCGGSSGGTPTPTAPTVAAPASPTQTTSPTKPAKAKSHLASACSSRPRGLLSRYGSVTPSPFTASNLAKSCHFESSGGGPNVIVHLDSAPQPYVRMDREQVEFWQNVEWSHQAAHAAPYPMTSLGLGGYWFPLQRRLLTTDGVRLVTIKVRSAGSLGPTGRKSLAARLARIYLGPPVKPAGY